MKPNTAAFTKLTTTSSGSRKSSVLVRYAPELKPSLTVPTSQPPATPSMSATATSIGSDRIPASSRGATRYFIGLVDKVVSASIWSVTRIVPNSAAIAAPIRPATISPASTGPSSRVTDSTTREATALWAEKREKPV